jgi:hypothetical protein
VQAVYGFGSSFYESKQANSQASAYYNTGDKIHAEINLGDQRISWLNGNLPFPKPDLNGNCNFYAGVGFMENSQNKCTSTVKNLKDKCTTLLNPQFLADNLKVMLGTDQVERQSIKIDEVYALQVDGSVIKYQASSLKPSVFAENDCSCSNFIRELRYKFYISSRDPKNGVSTQTQYAIDEIYVDIVVQPQALK